MRHLLDIMDFSVVELQELIGCAKDIIAQPKKYAEACHGKKLATLFFYGRERFFAQKFVSSHNDY